MFCWRCGKAIHERAEFCGSCGVSVKNASVDNSATSTVSASTQGNVSHDAAARHKLWIVLGVYVAALALLLISPMIVHKIQSVVTKSKQEQEMERIAETKAQYPVVDAIEHECTQFADGDNVLTRSADYSTIYYSWVTNGDTMASLAVFSCIAEQSGAGTDLETATAMMSTTLAMASQNFGYGIVSLEEADYSQLSDQMSARCVLDISRSEVLCQIIDGSDSSPENVPDTAENGGYYSSQEWYAPADSQLNPQTDVAQMFWTCSPQSAKGNDFQYHLNDDQSELMVRAYPAFPGQMVPVDCLASQLGMDSAMLQSGEGSISGGGRYIWRIGDLKITSRPMSTDTGGWIDLWIRQER